MIGTEYEVRVDDLELLGIYDLDRPTEVTSMTVVPPPYFDGSEVAFRCAIPKGQRFRIVAARHQFFLFDNGLYYLVEFSGAAVPEGIPIQLELFRGNEGIGTEPNARRYRKIGQGGDTGRAVSPADRPIFTCPKSGSVSDSDAVKDRR